MSYESVLELRAVLFRASLHLCTTHCLQVPWRRTTEMKQFDNCKPRQVRQQSHQMHLKPHQLPHHKCSGQNCRGVKSQNNSHRSWGSTPFSERCQQKFKLYRISMWLWEYCHVRLHQLIVTKWECLMEATNSNNTEYLNEPKQHKNFRINNL